MQIQIIGYEEARTVKRVGKNLVPSRVVRRYLELQFPDGTVEKVRASRAAVDKYIASRSH